MSDAIKVVEEEISRIRKNYPEMETALLDVLEARLRDRIRKELIEIPEDVIRERCPSLGDENIPDCFVCKDGTKAAYEGWARKTDSFTQQPTGMTMRIQVCEDHKGVLIGAQEQVLPIEDDIPF